MILKDDLLYSEVPTIDFAPKQKIMKILFWIVLVINVQLLNQFRRAQYSNLNPFFTGQDFIIILSFSKISFIFTKYAFKILMTLSNFQPHRISLINKPQNQQITVFSFQLMEVCSCFSCQYFNRLNYFPIFHMGTLKSKNFNFHELLNFSNKDLLR